MQRFLAALIAACLAASLLPAMARANPWAQTGEVLAAVPPAAAGAADLTVDGLTELFGACLKKAQKSDPAGQFVTDFKNIPKEWQDLTGSLSSFQAKYPFVVDATVMSLIVAWTLKHPKGRNIAGPIVLKALSKIKLWR